MCLRETSETWLTDCSRVANKTLFGVSEDKAYMFRHRYEITKQRVLRNPLFASAARGMDVEYVRSPSKSDLLLEALSLRRLRPCEELRVLACCWDSSCNSTKANIIWRT